MPCCYPPFHFHSYSPQFLFLVLYPLLPPSPPPACPPSCPPSHSHSLTQTHTSLTLTSHKQSLTHSPSLTHTHTSLTLRIHHTSQSHTPHTHTHFTHTYMYALASLWRPSDIPWSPPLCRWLLRGRRGTWCTAKGSDVRPGASPVSLGLRRLCGFCVAGAGLGALQRGRMYAPVPLRCPLVSAAFVVFVWQARDLVHCKGVGCTPRCLSGVPWSPPPLWFLCGRRGTWCTAKGSDVRPGASPVSLDLRRLCGFCVAGAGLGALQRGRMYAPVPLRCPLVSAAFVVFVWQARDLVHCKGVGCTPRCLSGVPWSPPPLWFLCGRRGTWCTAKGSDVRLSASPVSLGLRRLCGFCVAGAGLGALQRGRMYAPVSLRCPLVSTALPVALACIVFVLP